MSINRTQSTVPSCELISQIHRPWSTRSIKHGAVCFLFTPLISASVYYSLIYLIWQVPIIIAHRVSLCVDGTMWLCHSFFLSLGSPSLDCNLHFLYFVIDFNGPGFHFLCTFILNLLLSSFVSFFFVAKALQLFEQAPLFDPHHLCTEPRFQPGRKCFAVLALTRISQWVHVR